MTVPRASAIVASPVSIRIVPHRRLQVWCPACRGSSNRELPLTDRIPFVAAHEETREWAFFNDAGRSNQVGAMHDVVRLDEVMRNHGNRRLQVSVGRSRVIHGAGHIRGASTTAPTPLACYGYRTKLRNRCNRDSCCIEEPHHLMPPLIPFLI